MVLLGVCKSQVKRKIDLVYGGANVGLMGTISQKVYNGGCRVLGYMPKTTSFVVFSTSSMFSFPSVSYILSSILLISLFVSPFTCRIIPKALMPVEVFVQL